MLVQVRRFRSCKIAARASCDCKLSQLPVGPRGLTGHCAPTDRQSPTKVSLYLSSTGGACPDLYDYKGNLPFWHGFKE